MIIIDRLHALLSATVFKPRPRMTARTKVMKTFCTSAEAAQMLGVALRTVQLWSEAGVLETWKTSGGHRRINRQSVERLLVGQNKRTTDRPDAVAAAQQTAPTHSNFHILVAEDDESLRKLYQINLLRWPMQPKVSTASDGYEALIRMGHSKPDLLILDLNMPSMDGFRMLKTIRSLPELSGTTVVVVSGLDASEIQKRGGVPTDIVVLPKPIPFDRLQALAEQILLTSPKGASTS
jgi:excisionase family DNA binding protein